MFLLRRAVRRMVVHFAELPTEGRVMDYKGEDRRAPQGRWRLEKSISLGHIITTVAVAGSLIAWAMSMGTRVSVVETQISNSITEREQMASASRDGIIEIKAALIRIEAKLDNKVDKK